MARSSENNAKWYQHDNNMRNHRKVKVLKNKFGSVVAYAFWSMMLEILTESDGLEWEFSELETEIFASELGISAAEIRDMVDTCVKLELLFKTESNFVYSDTLNDRLKGVFEKRKKEKEKSKSRKRREDGAFLSQKNKNGGITAAETPTSGGITAAEKPRIGLDRIVLDNTLVNTSVLTPDFEKSVVEVESVVVYDEELAARIPPKVARKGSATKSKKKSPDEYSLVFRIQKEVEMRKEGYYWRALDGKHATALIAQMQYRNKTRFGHHATDDEVFVAFKQLLDNLPEFYQNTWDMAVLSTKFNSIVEQLKAKKSQSKILNTAVNLRNASDEAMKNGVFQTYDEVNQ